MSIHLLNKKGWHVWNQENVEKVKRDERLHSEEEKLKADAKRKAASEHRLSLLRKNATASVTETVVEDNIPLKRSREAFEAEGPINNSHSSHVQQKSRRSGDDIGSQTRKGESNELQGKPSAPRERTFRDVLPKSAPWYSFRSASHTGQRHLTSQKDTAKAKSDPHDPMANLQMRLSRQRELRVQETKHRAVSPLSTASTTSSHWTPISTSNFAAVLKGPSPLSRATPHQHCRDAISKSDRDVNERRERQEKCDEPHYRTSEQHSSYSPADTPRQCEPRFRHGSEYNYNSSKQRGNTCVQSRQSNRIDSREPTSGSRHRYQCRRSGEYSERYSRRSSPSVDTRVSRQSGPAPRNRFSDRKSDGHSPRREAPRNRSHRGAR